MQNSSNCETKAVSQYVHSDNITNGGGGLLVDQNVVFKTSAVAPSAAPSGAGGSRRNSSVAPGGRMQTAMAPTHSNSELGDDNSDSDSENDFIGNEVLLQSQSQHSQQQQQNQGLSQQHHQGLSQQHHQGLSQQHQGKTPPDGLKPGKKTKGRVKIKMEFIENKLRRYTTFSKRKTGIMKKAYELSTLTGTQVMLLVASETGHVYTFATRKLQPMITSESGKALIQTCLNSPDSSADGPAHQQRMNPTGFEETELTYSVEDDSKADLKPLLAQMPGDQVLNRSQVAVAVGNAISSSSSSPLYVTSAGVGHGQIPMASLIPTSISTITSPTTTGPSFKPASVSGTHTSVVSTNTTSTSNGSNSHPTPTNIAMHVNPSSLPAILQPGTQFTIPFQHGGQQLTHATATPQAMYRLPHNAQVVSIANMTTGSHHNNIGSSPSSIATHAGGDTVQLSTTSSSSTSPTSCSSTSTTGHHNQTVNFMSVPTSGPPGSTSAAMTPGIVMYQTPQGVVYATPTTATLPDGSIFNFQPSAAISMSTQPNEQHNPGTQQIITIPMPLAGSQVLQFATTTNATTETGLAELTHPTLPKKARK